MDYGIATGRFDTQSQPYYFIRFFLLENEDPKFKGALKE